MALFAGTVVELFGESALVVLFLWVAGTIATGAIPIVVIRIVGIVFALRSLTSASARTP